ncbi:family 20 glycosylhydrolase [Rubritalea tangerina]|uniref:beta-N-acetylhexosaminidase n=1 Tax=Rubritalea tangerina TaxID=430798 RepID=A0ABW4ZCF5_9BACT
MRTCIRKGKTSLLGGVVILLSWLLCGVMYAVDRAKPGLLPMPQEIEWMEDSVDWSSVEVVYPRGKGILLDQLKMEVESLLRANHLDQKKGGQKLVFKLGDVECPEQWKGQSEEAYRLVSEKRGVVITANSSLGLYRGVQTLRQLMVYDEGKTSVAGCEVSDYPAFKIRGFMHDVGRNFQSLEQLKMQIDVMAMYKYNVFHWHLTEYHGWRLESKVYPNLQADSSFERYVGKYYTQEEFKEMSEYCWRRGITIIPEFDSPGHSKAFRKGIGVQTMKDPRAIKAMIELIDELCSLVGKERMPYIHVGTDEVRYKEEFVDADYLPALHKAVYDNGREVIGWWKGMSIKGDTKQIQQTWAQYRPMKGVRHIDSRSNYVNHLESLDFASRMLFQQPCRVPHGSEMQLGGILAHWPDTRVEDEKLTLTNNPVIPAMVAYSESVWKGIEKDRNEYWAKLPLIGTEEFEAYVDFEERIAEQRDRFLGHTPFKMVKTHHIQWRLLGPVADNELMDLERGEIKDSYEVDGKPYNWTKPVQGAAIHTRHFFNFSRHLNNHPKGKDIVWANTHIYSPEDQEVDAWINFNTISSSDDRAGAARQGDWGAHPACNIWLNGKRIDPPKWKHDGKLGKEVPLIDHVYTSRAPSKIHLKKGWNTVLVKSARKFKWVFSFSPVQQDGGNYREVEGLKFSAKSPE